MCSGSPTQQSTKHLATVIFPPRSCLPSQKTEATVLIKPSCSLKSATLFLSLLRQLLEVETMCTNATLPLMGEPQSRMVGSVSCAVVVNQWFTTQRNKQKFHFVHLFAMHSKSWNATSLFQFFKCQFLQDALEGVVFDNDKYVYEIHASKHEAPYGNEATTIKIAQVDEI